MSRHRLVRKMVYEDEYDDDDYDDYDDDEDEIDSNPRGAQEFVYDRSSSKNYFKLMNDDKSSSPIVKQAQRLELEEPSMPPEPPKPPAPEKKKDVLKPAVKKEIAAIRSNRSEADLSTLRKNHLMSIARASSAPRRPPKRNDAKDLINMIVVGHVDAGKSTLMGHLLFELGNVDGRTMDKYKHEAAKTGKSSFAFAWVLDETDEERQRGVTMDVGRVSFETNSKRVVLLDAPGHKDFISNMITGTSQADAAILVVNATRGEFETGFANGGQTKEHAMLLRSLGVTQLIVAVNKLDTAEWSSDRFDEIRNVMQVFLTKQAGFSRIRFVPVSGLTGENLCKSTTKVKWYNGPCLLDMIDSFEAPKPSCDGPLRIVISDVLKITTNQLACNGKVESGEIEKDDKVFLMPEGLATTVKACSSFEGAAEHCMAGDYALITLNGTFEPDSIHPGVVVVRGGGDTLLPAKRFVVRIVVFDIKMPIMKGMKTELYAHSLCTPCTVVKLKSTINKTTGEVIKTRPRFVTKGMSAMVEIETENEVAIEEFTKCRALGRVTFRLAGNTIAAGIVENVIR